MSLVVWSKHSVMYMTSPNLHLLQYGSVYSLRPTMLLTRENGVFPLLMVSQCKKPEDEYLNFLDLRYLIYPLRDDFLVSSRASDTELIGTKPAYESYIFGYLRVYG